MVIAAYAWQHKDVIATGVFLFVVPGVVLGVYATGCLLIDFVKGR